MSTTQGSPPDSETRRITRWEEQRPDGISDRYLRHLEQERAKGVDLDFEARLLDALLPRRARILDAGCGQGRTGGSLYRRGHDVVGVDVDDVLIAAAGRENPGPVWLVGDLALLDLTADGVTDSFDAVVLAGDVMSFIAPGSEPDVLAALARHLRAGGLLVAGFHPATCSLVTFDSAAAAAGLRLRNRFRSWTLDPWPGDDSDRGTPDYCVTILERLA